MSIQFLKWDGFVLNVRTRFPFRHGIATLTACPHLIIRAKAVIDGQTCVGYSADHLPPKWFTKNPAWRNLVGHSDFERILEDLKKSYRRNQKNWKRLLAQVRD